MKSLTTVIQKPVISSRNQSSWRAGSALLVRGHLFHVIYFPLDFILFPPAFLKYNVMQCNVFLFLTGSCPGRPSRFPLSSGQPFSFLDEASGKTFLCGTTVLIQKYIFDVSVWNNCINTKIYFWWRSWEDWAWNKEHSCLHKLCGGTEIGIFLSFPLFGLNYFKTSNYHLAYQCSCVAFTKAVPWTPLQRLMCWSVLLLPIVILCIQIKAWLADKDAEALRCQMLLMEEEAAQMIIL